MDEELSVQVSHVLLACIYLVLSLVSLVTLARRLLRISQAVLRNSWQVIFFVSAFAVLTLKDMVSCYVRIGLLV